MQDDIVKQPTATAPPVPIATAPETAPNTVTPQPTLAQDTEQRLPASQVEHAENQQQEQPATKPKPRIPKMVIGTACLVCLLLVGLVVYLVANGGVEQKADDAKNPSSQTAQQTSRSAARQSELSTLSNEASALPDPDADPSSDLTDQALGL